MKVFVIIVTHNGMRWITKCIGSVLQSSIPVQIIVIDNGSTDKTVELIKEKFPIIEILTLHNNAGFGKANNLGIKKAIDKGAESIFLLNQDAFVDVNTIEILAKIQSSFPQYGILSPIHLNGSGSALDKGFADYIKPSTCPTLVSDIYLDTFKKEPYRIAFVNAAAWMLSVRFLKEVGGFSPTFFHYGEDVNLVHRAYYHEFTVGVVPFCRIYHDRENREPKKQDSKKEADIIALLIEYNNPNLNLNIEDDLKRKKLQSRRSLFLLKLSRFKFQKKEIEILKEVKDLSQNLTIYKTKGMNFL